VPAPRSANEAPAIAALPLGRSLWVAAPETAPSASSVDTAEIAKVLGAKRKILCSRSAPARVAVRATLLWSVYVRAPDPHTNVPILPIALNLSTGCIDQ
jgi:hypothetical protein